MSWSERDSDGRTVWVDGQGGRHDSPVTAHLTNEVLAQQVREQEAVRARATAGFLAVAWSFEEHRRVWSGAAGLACALWFAIGWFRRTDMSFLFDRLGRELGGDVATGVLVVAAIVIHGLVRRIVLRGFDLFRPRRLR